MRTVEKNAALTPKEKAGIFRFADQFLGLDLERVPEKRELTELQSQLLSQREIARADKDFVESDRLRDELVKLGIAVKDNKEGQSWDWLI